MSKEQEKKTKKTKAELEKELQETKAQLEEKTKEAQEHYENWLRAMAELDNMRKRVEKERSDYFKFANEQLIKTFCLYWTI